MPTLVADLHQLAAAVDPRCPSGDDLAYSEGYAQLERLARGRTEQQFGRMIYEAQQPHWETLQAHAHDLALRSHDLRIGVYLTQALTRTQGLTGFADGVELVTSWLTNEWDTLHPALDLEDEGEAVERSNILLELCEYERTLAGLLSAPLASARPIGVCTLADIRVARGERRAEGGRKHLTLPEIHAIFAATDQAVLQSRRADVERAERSLQQIERVFQRHTGTSPNLELVAAMLQDIRAAIDEFLPVSAVPERSTPCSALGSAAAGKSASPAITSNPLQVSSRRDVVAILSAVCDYYNRNEPSSPVPLLLNRARRLVDMDFVDIVRNLAPDGLADVSRWAGGLDADDQN